MLKAVIFDIDGTLLDSVDQHAQAWKETFDQFGLDIPFSGIRSQIGKGSDKLLDSLLSPEQIKLHGEALTEFCAELFKNKFLDSCKPFPDVKTLFEALRARDIKIALGSSAKKDEIEVYKNMLQISGLVDEAMSSEDVKRSKPDPDTVTAARQRLGGIPSADCCFIGDSPYDAAAASQDGTQMIGLLCGGFPEEELRSAGASEIFWDPSDLLNRWLPGIQL